MIDSLWLQSMMAGFPACYSCIRAFSETNTTEDLKKFDVPTLILHGDDDRWAKILAMIQIFISLSIVILLISRAVGVL